MKTSLEIDDRLYQAARLRAVREHTTVRALIERGLAQVLGVTVDEASAPSATELRALAELTAAVRALPLLHDEPLESILGYDEP